MGIFRDLVEEAIGEKTPKTLFIIHINIRIKKLLELFLEHKYAYLYYMIVKKKKKRKLLEYKVKHIPMQ